MSQYQARKDQNTVSQTVFSRIKKVVWDGRT
jgi:hypothetical protein